VTSKLGGLESGVDNRLNDPGAENDGLGECDGEEVRSVARGVEGGLEPKLKLVNFALALSLSSVLLIGVTGSSPCVGCGADEFGGGGFGGVELKFGKSSPSSTPVPNVVDSKSPVTLVRSGIAG
jgi:hypothetical protein